MCNEDVAQYRNLFCIKIQLAGPTPCQPDIAIARPSALHPPRYPELFMNFCILDIVEVVHYTLLASSMKSRSEMAGKRTKIYG